MKIPKHNDPSDFEIESFESYVDRWPAELDHVPLDVIKSWAYDHNEQVLEFTDELYDLTKWSFELIEFSNDKILEIMNFGSEMKHYDHIGNKFFANRMHGYDTAEFMQENGTFPVPIIVAHNAGKFLHHKSFDNEFMLEPYHLLEGNRRLAFLRAMIQRKHEKLQEIHKVWLVIINT